MPSSVAQSPAASTQQTELRSRMIGAARAWSVISHKMKLQLNADAFRSPIAPWVPAESPMSDTSRAEKQRNLPSLHCVSNQTICAAKCSTEYFGLTGCVSPGSWS
ncbi:hypothetical protein RRG08_016618 [Elysia crispata]|uniref:Uncharacterized protein n=1 Tax=Elysia crispata TaxID=231223 RepID=A0AAE1CYR0_9GAST|nr:hypothetical protein RRG08_016618 [Elysia crispata]